jgi:hypothetical protein
MKHIAIFTLLVAGALASKARLWDLEKRVVNKTNAGANCSWVDRNKICGSIRG